MTHQNKHIREAIEHAIDNGFTYVAGGKSHLKGVLLCPGGRGTCRIAIYGTPSHPEEHAKAIRREVDKCTHR